MSIRLGIAKRLNPFKQAPVFNLTDFGIVATPAETVNFSPMEIPTQDSVDPLEKPRRFEFIDFLDIAPVEDISDLIEEVFPTPEIETLFEPLTGPDVAGKRYVGVDEVTEDKGRQGAFKGMDDVRCRHGLIQGQCQTCQDQRVASMRRRREARTVDVFEQLYYILQPPIIKPDGQFTVFVNGNKPYNFQIAGIHWLVDKPAALLADQMGLGKTIQAIIAMRVLFQRGELQRVLVVCPASLTINWERELKSWAPELHRLRVHGSKDVRSEAWKAPAAVHIVSYETLAVDSADIPADHFDLCVLDEAQKIKNPATKNHRAVRRLAPKRRWALSGTPIENTSQDAVAIFSILVPGLFGAAELPNTATVRRKIAQYTLRRSIEDTDVDIPKFTSLPHWLELTDAQRARYDLAEIQGVSHIKALGDEATRINVLALISELKQICNYDEESGESCKLEFLKDALEEIIANDDKALVFSQYPNKTLRLIAPQLKAFTPQIFDGSLSIRERDRIVQSFQTSADNHILLMSIKAGGFGLTLTRANHVFHFDHWWNPAAVDQGTARIRRLGQNKPVFAHSLYTSNTIEGRIASILEEKRDTFRQVFGDLASEIDDDSMLRMTDEDLFGLFGLTPPGKEQPTTPGSSSSRKVPKKFADMTPEEFEESICTLFNDMGFNLYVTQRTRDGGIDLDGHRRGYGQGRVVVQCKRYSNPVGVGHVRELFGVISDDPNITEGFLVTTSRFTREARDFARGKRITLMDGTELEIRFSNLTSSDTIV